MFELQHLSGAVREVDNAAWYDRTTVVYLDDHCSSVAQVCDPHIASQRKRGMSRSHVVHVEVFAAGGRFTDEIIAIPRSGPNLIRLILTGLVADIGLGLNRPNRG